MSYGTTHQKISRVRGRAREYRCFHCGTTGGQRHWAYDHTDADEAVDAKNGRAYSTDVARYVPLCVSCHRRFDASYSQLEGMPLERPRNAPERWVDGPIHAWGSRQPARSASPDHAPL